MNLYLTESYIHNLCEYYNKIVLRQHYDLVRSMVYIELFQHIKLLAEKNIEVNPHFNGDNLIDYFTISAPGEQPKEVIVTHERISN